MSSVSRDSNDEPSDLPKPKKQKSVGTIIPIMPNWAQLPKEIMQKFLMKLGVLDIVTGASLVCSPWRKILKDPKMFKTIDMTSNPQSTNNNMVEICMNAITWNEGLVKHIYIENFGNDELLRHISDIGTSVRSLHLGNGLSGFTDMGLIKFIPKLQLLEDLQITVSHMYNETLEAIGQGCPMLKSLNISIHMLHSEDGFNKHAISIGKTMPGLRNLKITATKITCTGVEAILDGCTQLETLDLTGCGQIPLSEHIKDRCRTEITNFILPTHFNHDVLLELDDCDSFRHFG